MTVVTQPKPRQAAWASRPKIRIQPSPTTEDNSLRPLTATLDHPLVLNASLLTKIDMTAFTKDGLLAISKLCAVPLVVRGARKKAKRLIPAIASMEDEDSSSSEVINKSKPDLKEPKPRKKLPTRRPSGVDAVFGGVVKLPEPCRTCGRPEQPERLHSHPPNALIARKSAERASKPLVRTPITKPVPANFKSAEKLRREQETKPEVDKSSIRPRSGRPRTITCYICSREFGTASFPLHEPKCKQRWERENQQLPKELRRKLPERPSQTNMGLADWNDFAWQAAQAALLPCNRCGRTFNPDRLVVHQRSCKVGSDPTSPKTKTPPDALPSRPPTVPCYICGREFGTRSITIHEPQCLRKWSQENSQLPQALQRPPPRKPDIDMSRITGCYICGEQMPIRDRPAHERACLQSWRRANSARPEGERISEPLRPDYRFTESGAVDFGGTWHSIWNNHMDSLIPCRSCGRKFFPDRIERHETACANLPLKSKTTR